MAAGQRRVNVLLQLGLALGAIAGAAHAYGLVRTFRRRSDADYSPSGAVLVVLWTVGLWMLFGTYVLSLWLLATIVYAGTRIWQLVRPKTR